MSKIKVYSRGKYVGVEANSEGIPNLFIQTLGITAKVTQDNFEITKEAYDLLLKTEKSGDDMGEVDCFKAGDDIIFGWMGGTLALFDSDFIVGSNDFDFTLLEQFIKEDVTIPQEFIDMCDIVIQEDLDASSDE